MGNMKQTKGMLLSMSYHSATKVPYYMYAVWTYRSVSTQSLVIHQPLYGSLCQFWDNESHVTCLLLPLVGYSKSA